MFPKHAYSTEASLISLQIFPCSRKVSFTFALFVYEKREPPFYCFQCLLAFPSPLFSSFSYFLLCSILITFFLFSFRPFFYNLSVFIIVTVVVARCLHASFFLFSIPVTFSLSACLLIYLPTYVHTYVRTDVPTYLSTLPGLFLSLSIPLPFILPPSPSIYIPLPLSLSLFLCYVESNPSKYAVHNRKVISEFPRHISPECRKPRFAYEEEDEKKSPECMCRLPIMIRGKDLITPERGRVLIGIYFDA